MLSDETNSLTSLDAFQAGVRNVCGQFLVSPPEGARDIRGHISVLEFLNQAILTHSVNL